MARAGQILGNRIGFAADPYAAAKGADAVLILTEWKEFAGLDLARLKRCLRSPILLDGRNLYCSREVTAAGLEYHSVGRPLPRGAARRSSKSGSLFSNGHTNGHANGHAASSKKTAPAAVRHQNTLEAE
jgi:hypothetical protein